MCCWFLMHYSNMVRVSQPIICVFSAVCCSGKQCVKICHVYKRTGTTTFPVLVQDVIAEHGDTHGGALVPLESHAGEWEVRRQKTQQEREFDTSQEEKRVKQRHPWTCARTWISTGGTVHEEKERTGAHTHSQLHLLLYRLITTPRQQWHLNLINKWINIWNTYL